MDFKSRPPRTSNLDGFISRPRPMAGPQSSIQPGFTPLQRRSSVGFADTSRRPNAHSKVQQPMQQQQQPFTNFYSSYRGERAPRGKHGEGHAKQKKQRPRWKKIMLRSGMGVLVCGVIIGGWLGLKIVGNLDKVFHGNLFSDVGALASNTTLKGQAQGRINILLLGDSSDRTDATSNGGDLTDSIMVASLDTKHHTAFMLSVPRDLWVNIPGAGYNKINATYEYRGFSGVEQLIQADLGIPIDYYALVNYSAFMGIVNAVGGVTVDIQSPDPRGLYDPQPYPGARAFYLSNGVHQLSGQQALDLARARGDAYGAFGFPQSDFNRTQHQRQLMLAIAKKAESIGVVTNPLKISQIFDTLGSNVKTDLNLADVLELVKLTKNIPLASIQSEGYSYGGSNPLLTNYATPTGQSALVPTAGVGNFSQLQAFYRQLTSNNPVAKEGASIAVLNASDVVGLAHKEALTLESDGFNVGTVADAAQEYPSSMIVDLSGSKDPATKQALQQILSSNTTVTTSVSSSAEAGEAQGYQTANFVVILGKNWDSTQ